MIEKGFMYLLIFIFAPFYGSAILNFKEVEYAWYSKPFVFIYPLEDISLAATFIQSWIVGILPSLFITTAVAFSVVRLFEIYLEHPVRVG